MFLFLCRLRRRGNKKKTRINEEFCRMRKKKLSLNFEKGKIYVWLGDSFQLTHICILALPVTSIIKWIYIIGRVRGVFPFCESDGERISIEDLTRYGVTQAATQQLMSLGGNRDDCGKATKTRRRKTIFHFPLWVTRKLSALFRVDAKMRRFRRKREDLRMTCCLVFQSRFFWKFYWFSWRFY